MTNVILLTGKPGVGKTTVIQKVLDRSLRPAGGFYTQEVRQGGIRQGFEIVTLDGQRAMLAQVGLRSRARVSKYGVNLAGLDEVGVSAIRQAIAASKLVVIDEIGPMEIISPLFRQAVLKALDSPSPVLATIVQRSMPFTDEIKSRPQVSLFEVLEVNRQLLPEKVLEMLINT